MIIDSNTRLVTQQAPLLHPTYYNLHNQVTSIQFLLAYDAFIVTIFIVIYYLLLNIMASKISISTLQS